MVGCQKHAPNKLANSHLNGLNVTGWCGWFSSFNYWEWFPQSFPKATRNEYLQYRTGDGIILYEGGSTCVYNLGNGIHWLSYLHCFWFYVHCSYDFCWPSWFSSVLFFPPSTVPILPKNIPKQETNNKNTFEISHPPKIPNKNKPKKKPAPFLWHSWSKIGWTSSTTPAAQTLEGVEGDLAWIAGKNYGNIIYRWRFYLWF